MRGVLRWLFRFSLRAAALLVGLAVVLSVLAGILYVNRVRVVNQALGMAVEPFRVSVGEIQFHRPGRVLIEDLILAPKNAPPGSVLAKIPSLRVTYGLAQLRSSRQFRDLVVEGAEIRIDEGLLAGFAKPEAAPPSAGPPSLDFLSIFTGSLQFLDCRISVEFDARPPLEATWELRAEAPGGAESNGLPRESVALALNLADLSLGEEGAHGRVALVSASGRIATDLSRLEIDSLRIADPVLRIDPDLFATEAGNEVDTLANATAGDTGSESSEDEAPSPLATILIGRMAANGAAISVTGFDGRDGRALVPDLAFSTSFATEGVSLQDGSWEHEQPLEFAVTDLAVGFEDAPFLSAGRVSLSCESLGDMLAARVVPPILFEGADLFISDRSLAWLERGEAAPDEPIEAEPEEPTDPAPAWTLAKISFGDGNLLMRDYTIGDRAAHHLAGTFSANFRGLKVGGDEGFGSQEIQNLRLGRLRLHAPGAALDGPALISFEAAELDLRPSDFREHGVIDRLEVAGASVFFTDDSLGDWLREAPSTAADETEPAAGPAAESERPVYRISSLSIEDGRVVADSNFSDGRVPKIEGGFSITNAEKADAYELVMSDLSLRNHPRLLDPDGPDRDVPVDPLTRTPTPVAESEVFRVEKISAAFTGQGMLRDRRLERLSIEGAELKVGEGLRALAGDRGPEKEEESAAPAPDEPAAAAPEDGAAADSPRSLPPWTVGQVEVTRSRVQFEAMIPQVEGLQFQVETRLDEVPLSLDGLLAQEAPQKIELAGIEITDPYSTFITVAELPTIFVGFTLAGLARQEIDRIELVGPALHVGQGLFWWIEYQRNYRERNEGARIGIKSESEAEAEAESDAEADKGSPGWVVRTVEATAGKIVIAPTGVPLGVVPFPFNATTKLGEGEIELQLNIPDEDHVYSFADFRVELQGLAGDVQFNVPLKDEDNNLVQTFSLKRAKWREFDAEDLYITVTFDANGIYGLFGGAAYGGYAEGGFDFYLDDEGKWDAWVSGTGIESGPITERVAPDNFLMQGPISLRLSTEGRGKSLGLSSGEFIAEGPGQFDITKLGGMIETLPPEWGSLQRGLTELSLEALKRFDYDSAVGNLSFAGLDGDLDLRFDGPYGSRVLRLHLHDETGSPNEALAAVPVAPLPEASAKPLEPAPESLDPSGTPSVAASPRRRSRR